MFQQTQRPREPIYGRLDQQRGTTAAEKPKPTVEELEELHKSLVKTGRVLPAGQKKKPVSGETAGAPQAQPGK